METVQQYINKYGKIEILDKESNFAFWCDGKNIVGGVFKPKSKRML